MRLAQASVRIDAPIDVVWAVMLDLASYPQWNPFIRRVVRPPGRSGPARVGEDLTLVVRFGDGRRVASPERVVAVEPPAADPDGRTRRARLVYRFAGWFHRTGLIRGRRYQVVTQADGEPTVYQTIERFRGLVAFIVSVPAVRDGFQRHAEALKHRAEELARAVS